MGYTPNNRYLYNLETPTDDLFSLVMRNETPSNGEEQERQRIHVVDTPVEIEVVTLDEFATEHTEQNEPINSALINN